MEDRTNEHLVIYDKNNQVIATGEEGAKQVDITNLTPATDYPEGSYTIAWARDNGDISDKIDVPDFETLAILVSSISTSMPSITGKVGDQVTVQYEISPSNATDKEVDITSADDKVASLTVNGNSYVVTLNGEGQTKINLVSKDGGATLSQDVTVNAVSPAPSSSTSTVSSAPASTVNAPASSANSSAVSSPASSASSANSSAISTPTSSANPASSTPASSASQGE